MQDNKNHPKDFIYFDTSKTYLCPMIRSETVYLNEIEDIIEVKLEKDRYGYFVYAINSGYEVKYFYDKYLEWLFYTGYIKDISNK